jgi:hypothetical protein
MDNFQQVSIDEWNTAQGFITPGDPAITLVSASGLSYSPATPEPNTFKLCLAVALIAGIGVILKRS